MNKYQCNKCGAIIWRRKAIPCFTPGCDGMLIEYVENGIKCSECDNIVYQAGRKTCSEECAKNRTKRLEKEKNTIHKCQICGGGYIMRGAKARTCGRRDCIKEMRVRDLAEVRRLRKEARLRIKPEEEMLGPETPMMPTRKCHDCGCETYDYRCDRCRAKFRARNGASGLSGISDLFHCGHINVAVAY